MTIEESQIIINNQPFGVFAPETLPSRYLRTYAAIEKMWGNTPLERSASDAEKR